MLGFGVVWWSIATILTPIAARIGLPFLLMMRAFMGIGEVGFVLYLRLRVQLIFCDHHGYQPASLLI